MRERTASRRVSTGLATPCSPFGKRIRHILHQRLDAPARERRGHFAHEKRPDAQKARPRGRGSASDFGLGDDAVRVHGVEIHHFGNEQQLPCDPRGVALALETLVNEALMRRMLIDDDDAVLRLRDDVGAVNLRARRAERAMLGGWLVFASHRAAIG